jgi:hypothetical protein
MKPEAIKPDDRQAMAIDALEGVSIPDLALKYFDMGLASASDVSDVVLGVFNKAAPEIMRSYPNERHDLSKFLTKLRKDTRRQLKLAIRTKTRGKK